MIPEAAYEAVVAGIDGVLAPGAPAHPLPGDHPSGGARAFADAVAAIKRWRRGGLKLAAISTSHGDARLLQAAGLADCFHGVVEDPAAAGEAPQPARLRAALTQLGTTAGRAVLFADSAAAIRAAREVGFGLVIGVDRAERAAELQQAGADQVVRRLDQARFPRALPPALSRLDEIADLRAGRSIAALLDYDGTLTPIVADPGAAHLAEDTRTLLSQVAAQHTVAIVSGRDRRDVEARVGLKGLCYAGSHGFDIAAAGHSHTLPEAERAMPLVDHAERALQASVSAIPGVILERKRFSIATHYRKVEREADVERVHAEVAALAQRTGLRQRPGKKVIELEPAVDWHKGRAVTWLLTVLQLDPERTLPIYIGDDETDEDAFAALSGQGLGLRVGEAVAASLADYRLADPQEVTLFLRWLCPPADAARS